MLEKWLIKKVIDTLRKDKVTTYIVNIICQLIEKMGNENIVTNNATNNAIMC